MAYANKMFKPDVMIDMATLTGACVVALGRKDRRRLFAGDALTLSGDCRRWQGHG
ncbi:MAG: hypothetical protein R2874_13860 [Desulfobacterales bacterium]